MDVWLGPAVGFDYPNAKAVIYGKGDNPIRWISFLDVARFAVASLDNPGADNATLELGGPESITPSEVVRTFEKAGGKPFDVTRVPLEALQAQFASDCRLARRRSDRQPRGTVAADVSLSGGRLRFSRGLLAIHCRASVTVAKFARQYGETPSDP